MEKKQSVLSYILVAVLSVVMTLACVVAFLWAYAGGFDNLQRGAKLMQILHVVQERFVEEADLDAATDMAAVGMIQSLDDRWSRYMTAEEYSAYSMQRENNYRGIGVTISACDEGFLVENVSRDTPAYEAGILPGEKLTTINGESMAGWTTGMIQQKIRQFGEESFTLTVLTAEGESRDVSLNTVTVYSSPVSYEMLDGTGYIVLKNFSTGCAEDSIAAIEDLISQGAEALVFDVRYNGGGYVHELTRLLDYLLPEGDIFISRTRDGRENVTTSDAKSIDLPMAVLINSESYSAAELFAAQLGEFGAADIVGQATTGKGRSQSSFQLFDGSAVHISQEVYLTSKRVDLAAQGGLQPDVPVDMTEEQSAMLYYGTLPTADDPQLQAALEAVSK